MLRRRARTERASDKENELRAVRKYIEVRHRDYGVALFVIPALFCACAVFGVGYFPAWTLR